MAQSERNPPRFSGSIQRRAVHFDWYRMCRSGFGFVENELNGFVCGLVTLNPKRFFIGTGDIQGDVRLFFLAQFNLKTLGFYRDISFYISGHPHY